MLRDDEFDPRGQGAGAPSSSHRFGLAGMKGQGTSLRTFRQKKAAQKPSRAHVQQTPVPLERIERRIHLIRGEKVMLDTDLVELYQFPHSA